jgi:hypothetical protein
MPGYLGVAPFPKYNTTIIGEFRFIWSIDKDADENNIKVQNVYWSLC